VEPRLTAQAQLQAVGGGCWAFSKRRQQTAGRSSAKHARKVVVEITAEQRGFIAARRDRIPTLLSHCRRGAMVVATTWQGLQRPKNRGDSTVIHQGPVRPARGHLDQRPPAQKAPPDLDVGVGHHPRSRRSGEREVCLKSTFKPMSVKNVPI